MLQRVSYWILAMLPMLAMDIATIVCLSLMHFHSIGGMSNQKQSCVFFCILTHHTMPKLLTFTVPNKKDQKFSTKTTKNHLRDGHAMSSPMVVPVAPVAPVAPFQGAREAQPQRSCWCTAPMKIGQWAASVFWGFFSTFFTWLNPKTPWNNVKQRN